jgi:hypothetical protein
VSLVHVERPSRFESAAATFRAAAASEAATKRILVRNVELLFRLVHPYPRQVAKRFLHRCVVLNTHSGTSCRALCTICIIE